MSRKSRKDPRRADMVKIVVGTAGIGGQRFMAMIDDGVANIDRHDEDDENTFDTPGEALRALADELDHKTLQFGWFMSTVATDLARSARRRQGRS